MKQIYGMYFSGTGTTAKVVTAVARGISTGTGAKPEDAVIIDFSPLEARKKAYSFTAGEAVVFGVPVIAGRVPNVLLKFLDTLQGGGALAVPIVLYGNRNFDDALMELRNILEEKGFHTIAAAAFIGEHSFSRTLAAGRPDGEDMKKADAFARAVAEKLMNLQEIPEEPIFVDGEEPLRGYYQPRDRNGVHINILKVKPKLDMSKCTKCGICVEACPMGSIKKEAPGIVDGICIKCCGCEKKCPEGALYFDDPGYLYHKEELEIVYADRQEPKIFI